MSTQSDALMDDQSLLRYSRHLLLNEIGVEGQERIAQARVLQVGAGGLGSPAAMYLVAAGVGELVLFDDDRVDLTNLQRQLLHTSQRIGQPKAESAAITLLALNPLVRIETHSERVTAQNLASLLGRIDVVLDCSDNRATRYAVNRACLNARIPLVSASASVFAGQLAVFDFRHPDTPCYACLFPEGTGQDDSCATTGVFAPLVGVIGALQAGEVIKLLCGFGEPASGRLLSFDGLEMQFHRLQFRRDPGCAVCAR
ncbi:MAG TPA: molybdopterin-synthase adenylyltransferase MoeB [Burkholderiaceae bacterium]|nr:molybdopterin-synthase adenylyltransferase MoeB [Burkholderiaceae bacterium]